MALVTWFAVLGYGACSSLMLIVNKLAVHLLPAPSFVLLLQFFFSWFAVKVVGCSGCIVVDKLEWKKLLAFLPVSLAFLAAVFANIKTLQFANVETFVVFRASTPLTISICDYLCLGRELPSFRSAICLVALLGAAAAYVATDAHFVVHGYIWVGIWYIIFCLYVCSPMRLQTRRAPAPPVLVCDPTLRQVPRSLSPCARSSPADHGTSCRTRACPPSPSSFSSSSSSSFASAVRSDQLYIKHAVDTVQVESNWGRVFYTNLWAFFISGAICVATEPETLRTFQWSWASIAALGVSCALGVAMSYFAFLCRSQVSATHFTVIGNVCKVITVIINICIWDKHASPEGVGFLLICLFAAFLYKPSPLRAQPVQPEREALVDEEGRSSKESEDLADEETLPATK